MGLADLCKRVRELEIGLLIARATKVCNCRFGQETMYHSAAELAKLLKTYCPIHEVRDLGHFRCVPAGVPLRPEDRALCSCSRSTVREFVQDTRGPLSREEFEEISQAWEAELTAGATQRFQTDEAQAKRLLQQYEASKRRADASSRTLPWENKRW